MKTGDSEPLVEVFIKVLPPKQNTGSVGYEMGVL